MTPPETWITSGFPAPEARLLNQGLVRALREVAKAQPDAVALIQGGKVTRFGQLFRLVKGLAEELRAVQAPPGPVAVLMQASPLSVAAWFACAWAGRPLLLLEPGNPEARNLMLIQRAGAQVLLHDLPLAGAGIATLTPSGRPGTGPAPDPGLGPEAPALLFPTSGSTGEPKIIAYAARTLQAKLRASQGLMRVTEGDRVLIAGSHANYGFLHHALVFLLAGGALCLVDVKTEGLAGLFAAIQTQGVRHVRFTPSLFRLAASQPEGAAALGLLQGLRFSGEPFLTSDLDLARRVAPAALIQNVYGSTESALFIWTDLGQDLAPGTVPIGRIYPLSSFTLRGQEGPGDAGELVIKSGFHALGDWQEGRIDTSRFAGGLYATGDVARLTASGDLEVLGRQDRVVKINGQRVSLDEIESHLGGLPGLGPVAVAVREGAHGNPLVAFVTGTHPDPRGALSRLLPPHMIPGQFQWQESLPLLPGGKTDRKALLAGLEPLATPAAASAEGLAALVARILKLPSVGMEADFFSLGGDSLLLMDLQLEIQRLFGQRLDVEAFVARATLRELLRQLGPQVASVPVTGRAEGVELDFRQITPGAQVALIPPGLVGGAGAETWVAAGNFPDHALWACDARFSQGRTIDGDNWQRAVLALAQAIRGGKAPEPALMAGYSLGGFLSWATARELAPELAPRLVLLDAWPVHRLPRPDTRPWAPRPGANPETLLLACEDLERLRLLNTFKRRWSPEDGAMHRLTVPTLDHIEIGKPQAMATLATLTRAFAAHGLTRPLPTPPAQMDTMAGRFLQAWKRQSPPLEIEALVLDRKTLQGAEARMALLYLAALFARPALARDLAAELAALPMNIPFFAAAPAILSRLPETAPPADWARVFPRSAPLANKPETLERAIALRL
ncbi:non-ribosomal peptide synthetase [Stagnihabitans tardus]|uniref:AMP-binding protein n=1 Tax=Stagnihabitans tardus TaxID=2699202 RepID=A0AAE4Y900_9RHOB|nr:AMP-binding protein [Stagnihabitans tardus]NBZ88257.1 AMP-binding protein [Stagnihabitans tardus]